MTLRLYLVFVLFMTVATVISCTKRTGDFLVPEVQGQSTNTYIVTAGGDTNHRGIAMYNLDGDLVKLIRNYRKISELGTPRGVLQLDNDTLLVTLYATNRLEALTLDGESTFIYNGSNLAGLVYDSVRDANGVIYTIDSNTIERFNSDGTQASSPYIGTTVGACVLSAPRQMILNSSGYLVVTSYTNNRILTYDVSGITPTCVTSTTLGADNPYGIFEHSNGDLYFTTHNNDQLYRADPDGANSTVIFATNTTILSDPTSIVELPNGDLLVSSAATDTVERFDQDGNWIETFINDTQSLNITDLAVITRDE